MREYLQPPYPGAPSDLADFAVWRWERHPETDPFLRPATAPWVAAAAALTDARRELHHTLAAGSLIVHVRDAAGILKAMPRNEWRTRVGADLIQTGVAGGDPVRDDPAFVAEAPFAAWLLGCSLSDLALIEQCALPSAMTLTQACGWIMLRRPEAARDPSANLADMLLTHGTKNAAGPDFEGALTDLLLALRDGTLPATARDCGNDVPVPARRWRTLLLVLHGDGFAAFDAVPPNQRGMPTLTGVAVSGTHALALWASFATGTAAAAPQGWAKQEQEFIGPVPERWCARGAPGVWPFRDAATIFSIQELCRLVDIKSHGMPPDHHVMPQPRDIHASGLAEAWWKPNDMHTPILLQRLLRGELRAFGIPGRVGATVPEWIAPQAWRDLKSDSIKQERFEGGGNVYWHVRVVSADQIASEGAGPATAAAPAATGLLPYPEATHWLAWNAASWRAFGTLDAPEHIVRRRSFDHGTVKLPDEPDADYATRQDEHRRFDAAERELMDLLASGRIKAKGQPPVEGAPHEAAHGSHVDVPAGAFLDRRLAFDPGGKLVVRLDGLARLFPPLELRGTKASPEHPLWHYLLIEAAGLREA